MPDPDPDSRETRDEAIPRPPDEDPTAEASRPVGLALLLVVGGVMAALVAGLVWSTGRGLHWW